MFILINSQRIKPSREVQIDDIISVKSKSIFRKYKVLAVLKSRVGAKLVENYIMEITPEEDLFKLKLQIEFEKIAAPQRDKNKKGRPTKKERRDLDKFVN